MSSLVEWLRLHLAATKLEERERYAEAIVKVITPSLKGFIAARCGSKVVDDLAQESLIGITRGWDRFRGDTDKEFWGYCFAVTRHKIYDYWRKSKTRPLDNVDAKELWRVVEATAKDNPVLPDELGELEKAIGVLEKASPECCELLLLRYVLRWTHEQVGLWIGKSSEAARKDTERCLKRARILLGIGD